MSRSWAVVKGAQPRTWERLVALVYGVLCFMLAMSSFDAIGTGGLRLTFPYVWPTLLLFAAGSAWLTVWRHNEWIWTAALIGFVGGPIGRAWDLADQWSELGRPWQAVGQWTALGAAFGVSWIAVGMLTGVDHESR